MEDLDKSVALGNEARRILTNPAFTDVFEKLHGQYLADIAKSTEVDSGKREVLYFKLRVLQEVKSELGITEQNGVKADHDIKQRRKRNEQN